MAGLDLKGIVLGGEANTNKVTRCGVVQTTSSERRAAERRTRPTEGLGQSRILHLGCDQATNLHSGEHCTAPWPHTDVHTHTDTHRQTHTVTGRHNTGIDTSTRKHTHTQRHTNIQTRKPRHRHTPHRRTPVGVTAADPGPRRIAAPAWAPGLRGLFPQLPVNL